jgi:hypothetical protein
LVPQTGQIPCVAGLPFFILTFLGLFISRFLRHFTQYACIGTSFYIVNAQSVLKVYGCGKKNYTFLKWLGKLSDLYEEQFEK